MMRVGQSDARGRAADPSACPLGWFQAAGAPFARTTFAEPIEADRRAVLPCYSEVQARVRAFAGTVSGPVAHIGVGADCALGHLAFPESRLQLTVDTNRGFGFRKPLSPTELRELVTRYPSHRQLAGGGGFVPEAVHGSMSGAVLIATIARDGPRFRIKEMVCDAASGDFALRFDRGEGTPDGWHVHLCRAADADGRWLSDLQLDALIYKRTPAAGQRLGDRLVAAGGVVLSDQFAGSNGVRASICYDGISTLLATKKRPAGSSGAY